MRRRFITGAAVGFALCAAVVGHVIVGPDSATALRLLPTIATTDECTGNAVTGTKGETITFTRSTSAYCTKSSGLLVSMSANQPRLEYRGWLVEGTNTNLALQSRDLSNASWTKSNATCTKTATGPDAVANSASTCTASAANGTALQSLTVAAATRTTSLYVKRRTGTGNIDVTRNNGTNWTTLTSTQCTQVASPRAAMAPTSSEWVRCQVSSSVLNPTIGIRIVTSGDAVDVDLVQDEDNAFATSPIATTNASVQRTGDMASASTNSRWPITTGSISLDYVPMATTGLSGGAWIRSLDGTTTGWQFMSANNNGNPQLVRWESGAPTTVQPGVAPSYTVGTSYHYVVQWNPTTGTIYRDGVSLASGAFATVSAIGTTANIGSNGSGSTTIQGWMKNLCVARTEGACQ